MPTQKLTKTKNSSNKKNRVFNNDVVKELDSHWCSDYTKIERINVLVVMDLATQLILGYKIIFKTNDVLFPGEATKILIHLVDEIITNRCKTPSVFHSDNGGTYASTDFSTFLKSQKIDQSFAIDIYFGNQVIERWNRTFKQRLREKLCVRFNPLSVNQRKNVLNFVSKLSDAELKSLVYDVIQEYNIAPHSHLDSASPALMEEALLLSDSYNKQLIPLKENPNSFVISQQSTSTNTDTSSFSIEKKKTALINALTPLVSTTKSPNYAKIKEFKKADLNDLSNDWYEFILELATFFNDKLDSISDTLTTTLTTLAENQRETLSAITSSKDETIRNIRDESDRMLISQKDESDRVINSQKDEFDRVISCQKDEISLLKIQLTKQNEILKFLENEEIARKFAEKRRF